MPHPEKAFSNEPLINKQIANLSFIEATIYYEKTGFLEAKIFISMKNFRKKLGIGVSTGSLVRSPSLYSCSPVKKLSITGMKSN